MGCGCSQQSRRCRISPCCRKFKCSCCNPTTVNKSTLTSPVRPIQFMLNKHTQTEAKRQVVAQTQTQTSVGIPDPTIFPREFKAVDIDDIENIGRQSNFSNIPYFDANEFEEALKVNANVKIPALHARDISKADNDKWSQKHFIGGDYSKILAEVDFEKHACINWSMTQNIDEEFIKITNINSIIDRLIRKTIELISNKENNEVSAIIKMKQEKIGIILTNGEEGINQFEYEYRKLLEEFIEKLEMSMSIKLDELHEHLKNEQRRVFESVQRSIIQVSSNARFSKQQAACTIIDETTKRVKILMEKLGETSIERVIHCIGREEFRQINLQVYSTTDIKGRTRPCMNISNRGQFIKSILEESKNHVAKRTVYIQKN